MYEHLVVRSTYAKKCNMTKTSSNLCIHLDERYWKIKQTPFYHILFY